MPKRMGEIRSYDLDATEKVGKIVTFTDDLQYEILKSANGAGCEPLLLARYPHATWGQPKNVVVVRLDEQGQQSLVAKVSIPQERRTR